MKIKKWAALLCAALLMLSCIASYADEAVETTKEEPQSVSEPLQEKGEADEQQQEQKDEQKEEQKEDQGNEPVPEETYFTVRFVDTLFDPAGVLIGPEQRVKQGAGATAPAANDPSFPTHTGYHFTDWDKPFENVQQDLTVAARWEKDMCTVTFYDSFYSTPKLIQSVTVEYGANVTDKPAAPEHAGCVFYSESVKDADGKAASLSNVTSDLSVYFEYTSESEQSAALGKYTIATVKPGSTVTLAYPVILYAGNSTLASNAKKGASQTLDYKASRNPLEYAQDLTAPDGGNIVSFTLDIDTAQADALPFDAESMSKTAYLVVSADDESLPGYEGYGIREGETVNLGYAVFRDMVIPKSGLENAYYPIPLIASWETADGKTYSASMAAQIQVTGVKTSSGGGGGYSSYSSTPDPTPNPQAKLIIESITTRPANPAAGDKFDIILALHNTSEKLYLQNMQLTYNADDDALMPVNGSNTLYIPKIAQGSTYEAVLHVRSKPDLATTDVRLNVEMDFEDKELNALSASQTMILPVKQVQKITVDDPVLPTGTITVNNSYDIEMGVYNAGQTMLYNVTAQLECENADFSAGKRFFAGNMESGTAKTIELDFIPLAEGEYSGNVLLTYETINGEVTEHKTPFSVYASPEEEYDYGSYDDYFYEPVEEETASPAAEMLGRLNPIVFALAGGLLFVIIIAMGVSAKNKRKRAFEEDEMD